MHGIDDGFENKREREMNEGVCVCVCVSAFSSSSLSSFFILPFQIERHRSKARGSSDKQRLPVASGKRVKEERVLCTERERERERESTPPTPPPRGLKKEKKWIDDALEEETKPKANH